MKAGTFMIYESQRQRVARGQNLGLARAQNKGGVGLAFRYHDTAFGCCVVHLASDSKGRWVCGWVGGGRGLIGHDARLLACLLAVSHALH